MKTLFRAAGLGVLTASLFFGPILTARADDQAPQDNGGSLKMGHQSEMWKEKLGLTDSQVVKVTDLLEKQRNEILKLQDLIQVDRDSLKLKLDFQASDAALKPLLNKIAVEEKELNDKRESFREQFQTLLTPTQQAKLLLAKESAQRGWVGDSCSEK